MERLSTNIYSIQPGRKAKLKAFSMLERWWWILAIPLIIILLGGFWDWRIWLAGIGVALVIYPGIVAIAYYYCSLDPSIVREIRPHRIIATIEGLKIDYYSDDGSICSTHFQSKEDIISINDDGDYIEINTLSTSIEIPKQEANADFFSFLYAAFRNNNDKRNHCQTT